MKKRTRIAAYAFIGLHLAGGVAMVFTPPSWRSPNMAAVEIGGLWWLVVALPFVIAWAFLLRRSEFAWFILTCATAVPTILLLLGFAFIDEHGGSGPWQMVFYFFSPVFLTGLSWWIWEIGHWVGSGYNGIIPVLILLIIYGTAAFVLVTDKPRHRGKVTRASGGGDTSTYIT